MILPLHTNSWKAQVHLKGRHTRVRHAWMCHAAVDAAARASVTNLSSFFFVVFRFGPIQAVSGQFGPKRANTVNIYIK